MQIYNFVWRQCLLAILLLVYKLTGSKFKTREYIKFKKNVNIWPRIKALYSTISPVFMKITAFLENMNFWVD